MEVSQHLADSPYRVLESRFYRTEGTVLSSWMQQNTLGTLQVWNEDVCVQERLIQVPGSHFEGQNGFF